MATIADDLLNAPVPRATIDGIVGHRDQAVRLFAEAHEAVGRALKASSATGGGTGISTGDDFLRLLAANDADAFVEEARRRVDRNAWRHVVMGHGFERLMDRQALAEFRGQLDREPPEFNAEIAQATLTQLLGDADRIMRRGVANAFARLDRRFRSHDGFKIGTRVVLPHAFTDYGSWNHHERHEDTLRDIEKAFFRLDGREPPESYAGIVGAIDSHRRSIFGPKSFEAESEYFRVKAFRNGNAHLWFRRDDLLLKVNLLLAEHYGATLGEGSDATEPDPLERRSTAVARNQGWFPTPAAVVDRIVDRAEVNWARPRDGEDEATLRILEPSAGQGAIALGVRSAMADGGARPAFTCVEIDAGRVAALEAEGLGRSGGHHIVHGDFLAQTPDGLGLFDRIVMNPPFDRGLDVDHVVHAARFLAPRGMLVAVMSAGVEFREDARSKAFRAMVERMDGRIDDLPHGSFEESGTMVNTCIVTFRRRD